MSSSRVFRSFSIPLAVALTASSAATAADNFATYGALSVFGPNQSTTTCVGANSLASARLAIPRVRGLVPQLSSITDVGTTHTFRFHVDIGDELGGGPSLPPIAVEAWRTYVSLPAGTHDFVSLQEVTGGSRLSDAIRLQLPADPCLRLASVDVISGDMQVSAVGAGFVVPNIHARVRELDGAPARNSSVALASEVVAFEDMDSGIDGPKLATLSDAAGDATFQLTPGTKAGIKRFVVKARHAGDTNAVSAVVTLAHAPLGASTQDSRPVVEYEYDGGAAARPRFMTIDSGVVALLDKQPLASFTRTGQVWRAFGSDAVAGLHPVCQFFG